MEEKVALNRKERRRQLVLSKVREGKLVGWQAAEILGISVRQVRRLVKAYREGGMRALVHGNRGRTPGNA
jgi:transposase